MLRALSLCTCCRHYPGAAAGRRRSSHPAVSAFPDNVVGSACTSSFSGIAPAFTRVAARTLAPSPICDLLHRRLQPFCYLHDCSGCFRLERLPGGACTHWKAPPSHGAHVHRTLRIGTGTLHLGEERAFRESDSTFIGGLEHSLGGCGFLSQLWDERRRPISLMSPQC